MRNFLIYLSTVFICSCSSEPIKNEIQLEGTSIMVPEEKDLILSPRIDTISKVNKIIGERIDGPANIRDTIGGKAIFKLYDNTLVECTEPRNDWYQISIGMEISFDEYGIDTLYKGRKIILDGKEVGEILADLKVYTSTNGKQSWAELIGYTHKTNIKPETIIENAFLSRYIESDKNRSLKALKSFIDIFGLEEDNQFHGYKVFYNYENIIDDPSPMFRLGLVFQDSLLVAIFHSRELDIEGTTNTDLQGGFDCLTYDDFKDKKDIIRKAEHFINSVD